MTVKILLTQGQVAIVCDCHAHLVKNHRWSAAYHDKIKSFYAMRKLTRAEQRIQGRINVSMHQTIANTPKGLVTHHINHNTLDNRCCNLEIATDISNKQRRRDNTSGYIGVTWHKRSSKWQAQIMANKKHYVLGEFINAEAAARAYDAKARELFGANCVLNFAT